MEDYDYVASASSALFTRRYSTSFSTATKLFPPTIRTHIYNVYGLVRLADEIVDTYHGKDQLELLDNLEAETYATIKRGYTPNLTLQAFSQTARKCHIEKQLITAFFASMRMDITPQKYTPQLYKKYIYGSAEVVGLMCLRVFCADDTKLYKQLRPGAQALGSAFQKVNFLRDFADDHKRLQRTYFPGVTYDNFDEAKKRAIIAEIQKEFDVAKVAIKKLPRHTRGPVLTAFSYYAKLLRKLQKTPVETIKTKRVRLPNQYKIFLLTKAYITSKVMY